jgi:hypothetical protein
MARSRKTNKGQLELPFKGSATLTHREGRASQSELRPLLRLILGSGEKQRPSLDSRDAVVRVLIGAGADLLLRRISSERAEEIRRRVERIMSLFDQVDESPELLPSLKRRLDELESLMRETRRLQAGRSR